MDGGTTVQATPDGEICFDRICRPSPIGAGMISGSFATQCNTQETVYAIDDATGAYANNVALKIQCSG